MPLRHASLSHPFIFRASLLHMYFSFLYRGHSPTKVTLENMVVVLVYFPESLPTFLEVKKIQPSTVCPRVMVHVGTPSTLLLHIVLDILPNLAYL